MADLATLTAYRTLQYITAGWSRYYKDAKTAARKEKERGRIELNAFIAQELMQSSTVSSSIEEKGKGAAFVLSDGKRSMLLAAESVSRRPSSLCCQHQPVDRAILRYAWRSD